MCRCSPFSRRVCAVPAVGDELMGKLYRLSNAPRMSVCGDWERREEKNGKEFRFTGRVWKMLRHEWRHPLQADCYGEPTGAWLIYCLASWLLYNLISHHQSSNQSKAKSIQLPRLDIFLSSIHRKFFRVFESIEQWKNEHEKCRITKFLFPV